MADISDLEQEAHDANIVAAEAEEASAKEHRAAAGEDGSSGGDFLSSIGL